MHNVKIEYNSMAYLFDDTLSLKAKGLLALIVAYVNKNPKNESLFRLTDIRGYGVEGSSAFHNAITELEQHGYISKTLSAERTSDIRAIWYFTIKE